MPAYLPDAFLAAEDRRFYSHHGLDLTGIARRCGPIWAPITWCRAAPPSPSRWCATSSSAPTRPEAQGAGGDPGLEPGTAHLKTDILELYLNRIYFGDGAYGVEAASQTYFGKSASRLDLSEAAPAGPPCPRRPPGSIPQRYRRRAGPLQGDPGRDADRRLDHRRPAGRRHLASTNAGAEKPVDGDFGYVLDLAASRARDLARNRAPDLVVRLTWTRICRRSPPRWCEMEWRKGVA